MCEELTGQRIVDFGYVINEESKQSLGLGWYIKEVTRFLCTELSA